MNVSQEDYNIYSRPSTKKSEERIKTDEYSQIKTRISKGGINASPQPSNLRVVDKTLREKKN